ncbi:MAG: acylphosphatase [Magnetococcales bacterium]|nr:acylphosphatase [Magnetococcales bacterium]
MHVGFDLICEDIVKHPDEQNWLVIEVNTNPNFRGHHFPGSGTPRDVAGALIEELYPELRQGEIPRQSVRVRVNGKVQGIGFRRWVWTQAHQHALRGWVRNLDDGRVEALFSGTPHAVADMLALCRVGPRRSRVTRIDTTEYQGEIPTDFTIALDGH